MSRTTLAVVNFNSAHLSERLIELLAGEGVDAAVIVDNSPSKAELDRLRGISSRHPWVSVVPTDANRGFGAGVNQAVRALALGPSDLVWIANPDVEPLRGSCRRLASAIRQGLADIVSPLLIAGPPSRPHIVFAGGAVNPILGTTKHDLWEATPERAGTELRKTLFMTGAAFMLSGAVWEELGGFREDYFLYWEDTHLSSRADRLGVRMAVDCGAWARHEEGGSSRGVGRGEVYYEYVVLNRRRYLQEWAPDRRYWVRAVREVENLRLIGRALRERERRLSKARAAIAGRRARLPTPPE